LVQAFVSLQLPRVHVAQVPQHAWVQDVGSKQSTNAHSSMVQLSQQVGLHWSGWLQSTLLHMSRSQVSQQAGVHWAGSEQSTVSQGANARAGAVENRVAAKAAIASQSKDREIIEISI